MAHIILFTRNQDPNGNIGYNPPVSWPQWELPKPKAMIFQDNFLFPRVIGDDNYRTDAMSFMKNISLLRPI
jgi:acetylcholinesterase